jgi:hypothetical protein
MRVAMHSFRFTHTLHLMDHGRKDIIFICELFSEGEEIHESITKETNNTYSDSEPSVANLPIDISLYNLKDETCCTLEYIIDTERLRAGVIELEAQSFLNLCVDTRVLEPP